ALQFHDHLSFHDQIGYIFPKVLPFITNRKRDLSFGAGTTGGKFLDEGSFIDLFQESGAQYVGNLEGGSNYRFCQIRSVSIRGLFHKWPQQETISLTN